MKIRLRDYFIIFFITIIFIGSQLFSPVDLKVIIKLFVAAIINSLIVGTLTNLIFKSKKNKIKSSTKK